MHKDRTQSWIVISRGINTYVTKLSRIRNLFIHCEEVATIARQLVAMTTIYAVFIFIFVSGHADQSTEIERHVRHCKN